jgi:hypothetical protein
VRATLAFHKADGFRLAQATAFVLFPSLGEAGRKFQPHQLPADNGADIHAWNLTHKTDFDKDEATMERASARAGDKETCFQQKPTKGTKLFRLRSLL